MNTRYTLCINDEEFIQADQYKGTIDKPLGYPCLFHIEIEFGYPYYSFIYIPPRVKCLDSFIAGVNAVC